MNPLIQQFKKYGYLNDVIEQAVQNRTRRFSRKKGEHFLKEGQHLSSYFVLSKGLIRAYFLKNGREMNSWFGEENQIFGSILPVYTEKPSFENIQFLEDSEIYAISVGDLNELYRIHPELNLIGRKIAEEVCIILEERIMSLHTESAVERYRSLIRLQPKLLNRISLGHVASYLGITQETLSRIRR
ncbi:Crp/Fnr family transcriptional regulator [Sphingobacterium sp.]|jgi:CRP-like cAMP-binding protein|uniref:Crp/Fnr family transcriptional regulator n=1 Tax=Sphingobacterium sp. TaxID=341027 RepID=UPI0028A23FCD|nr:Crp/Fnr family transcriptional regulator [Sphingobacterium sp.]